MAVGPFNTRTSNGAFLMLAALIISAEFLTCKNSLKNASSSASKQATVEQHSHIKSGWHRSIINTVLFFIVNLALLLSFSRGVYLSYGLSLFCLFMVHTKRENAKNIIFLTLIILLTIIFLYLSTPEAIQHRLYMLEQEKSRLIIWKGAWHLWQASPWYGLGIGNFKYFYPSFSLPGDGSTLEYAHNDYLQLLIETGLLGVILLGALLLAFFYYCMHYLKKYSVLSSNYTTITTQIVLASSLVMCSFVDFIFYILSFNLMLGTVLGFLYHSLYNEGVIQPRLFIATGDKKILGASLVLVLLLITSSFTHVLLYNYYTNQAYEYTEQEKFPKAISSYLVAKRYLDSPYLYNNLASIYLEQAKKSGDGEERLKFIAQADRVITRAITLYPYNAEAYFQQGIIQALHYKDNVSAQAAFETSIQLKPHANFERLTFCYFLLEQDEIVQAQQLLEKGLLYPINPYYAPKYLELLANLRFKNGDRLGAEHIADAITHIETYRLDFSTLALANSYVEMST
jgi:hypothetical protein